VRDYVQAVGVTIFKAPEFANNQTLSDLNKEVTCKKVEAKNLNN